MRESEFQFAHYDVEYLDLEGNRQVVNVRAECARDAVNWVKVFVECKPRSVRVIR